MKPPFHRRLHRSTPHRPTSFPQTAIEPPPHKPEPPPPFTPRPPLRALATSRCAATTAGFAHDVASGLLAPSIRRETPPCHHPTAPFTASAVCHHLCRLRRLASARPAPRSSRRRLSSPLASTAPPPCLVASVSTPSPPLSLSPASARAAVGCVVGDHRRRHRLRPLCGEPCHLARPCNRFTG